MAQRTQHEPNAPPTFHLAHRYMDGLRFDGIWEYAVQTAAGPWHWKALPLLDAPSSSATHRDPQGAWWCVSQCATIMAQARLAAKLPKERASRPDPLEVEHVLQALLPGCEVQAEQPVTIHSITDLATVLEGRGCALLRLEGEASTGHTSSTRWVWMIGIEMQCGAEGKVSALLVVGPRWPAPWGSGFGAKLRPWKGGRWKLCSVDGEVMQGRVTAVIAVKPLVHRASIPFQGIRRRL
ncbi:hypothetical protein GCM10027082_30350 [Comamonas humi]